MYISKVESWTSPEPCGKDFTDQARYNYSRFCTLSKFEIPLDPIQGQNVGNKVASRSKTSWQNLTPEVSTAVVSSVVVGVSLSLPLGNMDGSSGVGDVTSSTSVGTSDSGDGGGSNANGGERGRGGDLGVAGDDGSDGVDGVGHGDGGDGVRDDRGGGVGAHNRGNSVGSVAVVGLSLSLPLAVVQTVAVAVAKTVSPVATV